MRPKRIHECDLTVWHLLHCQKVCPLSPLNPSQTYIATALRPLRDWQFSPIAEVATRSPDRSRRGCREVGDWSGTSLRPNQSQPGFCACILHIWSQTGPGEVTDQSPISRRLVADRSPINFVRIGAWLSLKLVGDWSAGTSLRPHCN